MIGGFLVILRRNQDAPVAGRMIALVSEIVWPFAQQLWRQLRGGAEMPADLRPQLFLHRRRLGPLADPPPTPAHPAGGAWSLEPVENPRYPLVEFTLATDDEVLSHGFYRLGEIFSQSLCSLADTLAAEGELRCQPGHYFYDTYALVAEENPSQLDREHLGRDELRRFSKDSFELPSIDDEDPHLDFELLADQPLAPAGQARTIFTVAGSCHIGETRFAARAWEELAAGLGVALDREVGGYLVGNVGEDGNGGEIVTIDRAVPAEFAAGDAHIFVLSPESGADIHRRIEDEWPDQTLVGWYHTHVFSSENKVLSGLSSIDEKTHDEQFTRRWQAAALINVWREAGTVSRQVRIFRRNGDGKLVDVDYSVVEDRGKS